MRRLLLLLVSIGLISASGLELHRRLQAQSRLMLDTAPLDTADKMLAGHRWQEARLLAELVIERPDLGDPQRADRIAAAADTAMNSTSIQVQDFLQGALSGTASNGASLLGALSLDLFLIGDLRDLAVQGYREIIWDDGDTVILALSATGLTLGLVPQLHWAPSLLKALKRSGALTPRFSRVLYRHAQTALRTGNFTPLARLVENFATATRALGPGPMRGAMHAVQTEADLARLGSAAATSPRHAYAVASLGGQRGLRQASRSGDNIEVIAGKLKLSSRLGKAARKSLGVVPGYALLFALLLGLTLFSRSLRRR